MPFIVDEATGARTHNCHRELRWSDFDQYQHVNNAKYLEFAQDARLMFLKDVLLELDIAVPAMFLRHCTIDYPRALPQGEAEVAINTWITQIGTKSCTMRQTVMDSLGRVACVIDAIQVGVDPISGKTREWTEYDLEVMKKFYIPVEDENLDLDGDQEDSPSARRTRPTEPAS